MVHVPGVSTHETLADPLRKKEGSLCSVHTLDRRASTRERSTGVTWEEKILEVGGQPSSAATASRKVNTLCCSCRNTLDGMVVFVPNFHNSKPILPAARRSTHNNSTVVVLLLPLHCLSGQYCILAIAAVSIAPVDRSAIPSLVFSLGMAESEGGASIEYQRAESS